MTKKELQLQSIEAYRSWIENNSIEIEFLYENDKWINAGTPSWKMSLYYYRVKQKPTLTHEEVFDLWFCFEDCWYKIDKYDIKDKEYRIDNNWYTLEELSELEYSKVPQQ